MIQIAPALLHIIEAHARTAYPLECCGLLAGFWQGDRLTITRVIESTNLADGDRRHDRFEVDPKVRFDLMRATEGTDESMVGHYHSHPDHPAAPSDTDRDQAFEPDLVWLICAVEKGEACETNAFRINGPGGAIQILALNKRP